jgi:hypothetical protein
VVFKKLFHPTRFAKFLKNLFSRTLAQAAHLHWQQVPGSAREDAKDAKKIFFWKNRNLTSDLNILTNEKRDKKTLILKELSLVYCCELVAPKFRANAICFLVM